MNQQVYDSINGVERWRGTWKYIWQKYCYSLNWKWSNSCKAEDCNGAFFVDFRCRVRWLFVEAADSLESHPILLQSTTSGRSTAAGVIPNPDLPADTVMRCCFNYLAAGDDTTAKWSRDKRRDEFLQLSHSVRRTKRKIWKYGSISSVVQPAEW